MKGASRPPASTYFLIMTYFAIKLRNDKAKSYRGGLVFAPAEADYNPVVNSV